MRQLQKYFGCWNECRRFYAASIKSAKNKIYNNAAGCFAGVLIIIGCTGCGSPEHYEKLSPLPPISDAVRQKSAVIKAIFTSTGKEFGMFVTMDTIMLYWSQPEQLAERLKLPGVTDVYFDIRLSALDDSNYYPAIRRIIAALHAVKIRCHIVIDDEQLYSAQNIDHDGRKVTSAVKSYNWYAPRESEFDGIVAVVNPHHIVSSNTYLKRGLLYSWQESNYGKNNENDMIMRQAFQILEEMKTAAKPLTLTVFTDNFYHDRNKKGDLSVGNINDFSQIADCVIISAYSKYAKEVMTLIKEELQDCKKNNTMLICLRADRSIYGENAEAVSMSRKKWPQLTEELTALVNVLAGFKSYRGICCNDFAGFELLLEKKD
jgi:hypothetical protein